MTKVIELLNAVKDAKGIKSDYALAKAIDIPKQRISEYYKSRNTPDEYACLKIAEALGKDYAEISAIVRIEAEKDENRREVWRRYYKSLGGFATSFMMMFLTSVTLIVTTGELKAKDSDSCNTTLPCNTNYAFFGDFFKRLGAFVRHTLSTCFLHVGLTC